MTTTEIVATIITALISGGMCYCCYLLGRMRASFGAKEREKAEFERGYDTCKQLYPFTREDTDEALHRAWREPTACMPTVGDIIIYSEDDGIALARWSGGNMEDWLDFARQESIKLWAYHNEICRHRRTKNCKTKPNEDTQHERLHHKSCPVLG